MSKNWKKIEVLIREKQDPLEVALNYTHCLTCKRPINLKWECEHCKSYIVFKSPEIK
jgi:hypothetical protein